MTDLDIQELANLTTGDVDVDHFERLFTKLKEMKGKWGNFKKRYANLVFYLIFFKFKDMLSLWRLNIFYRVETFVSL